MYTALAFAIRDYYFTTKSTTLFNGFLADRCIFMHQFITTNFLDIDACRLAARLYVLR